MMPQIFPKQIQIGPAILICRNETQPPARLEASLPVPTLGYVCCTIQKGAILRDVLRSLATCTCVWVYSTGIRTVYVVF